MWDVNVVLLLFSASIFGVLCLWVIKCKFFRQGFLRDSAFLQKLFYREQEGNCPVALPKAQQQVTITPSTKISVVAALSANNDQF